MQICRLSTVPPKQKTPKAIDKVMEYMNNLDQVAFRCGFILKKVMDPISTGHLELRIRNPNDNPSLTFNYFKDLQDLQRCVQGIQIRKLLNQSLSLNSDMIICLGHYFST